MSAASSSADFRAHRLIFPDAFDSAITHRPCAPTTIPTIEWPLSRDAPDIIGRIVVITLDPVASVAALNDEKATAAALAFPTRRYLALVKSYLNFLWTPDGPRLTLDFSPGSFGLPPAPNAWAAVPLFPAVPRGECTRPPVTPNGPPMPTGWDNCYLYTLHFTGGTVSRIHYSGEESDGPRLGEDEQMEVFMAQYEDRRKIGLAHRARRAEEAAARVDEAGTHSSEPDGSSDDPAPTDSEERREMVLHDPEIEDDDEYALMAELFAHDAVPRMTPHFEIWYDLSAFSPAKLGHPAQIQDEIERLEEIEWEWAQRMVAEAMSKELETNACQAGPEIGEADAPPAILGFAETLS